MRATRQTLLLALALATVGPAAAQERTHGPEAAWPDPAVAALVAEVLARSPEYARARADVEAERARVPQAGAWPEPVLGLGIQNDGFSGIRIGVAETSFWQVALTQPIPFPGKLALRREVARAQATAASAQLERVRLTVTADVERAYLALLLARARVELQDRLEGLWKEAEALAHARYQVGAAPQSDLLRAQLERTRLIQDAWSLEADEAAALAELNSLRGKRPNEAIPTPRRLVDLAPPPITDLAVQAADEAEARSPELARAKLDVDTARRRVALAERERLPDFSVTAGLMPRGSLDPMWLASVGVTLPFASSRREAVVEARSRLEAEDRAQAAVRDVVRLRATERFTQLHALIRISYLHREGLLVQSRAVVESALSQYRVGKVPFAAVLESLRGYVNDGATHLDMQARAHALAIAEREVSLDPPPPLSASMGGSSVPGSSGGMGGARAGRGAPVGEAPLGEGARAAASGM